jgi:hypothetical protein
MMLTEPVMLYSATRKVYLNEKVDWADSTKQHIIKSRKWVISPKQLDPIVNGSEPNPVRYITQRVGDGYEGGGYFFPIYDPAGLCPMAQIRWSKPSLHKNMKTMFIGTASELNGPKWCGMTQDTVRQIMERRQLLLVEGPFDQMACRVALGSDYPVVSCFGSLLTHQHIQDLQILGVRKIVLMFDADEAGERGAKILRDKALPFRVEKLKCPASDPSDCLQDERTFRTLSNLLKNQCKKI